MKSLSRSPSLYGSVLALAALTATPARAQSEGTKCQSLTDCDAGLTCVFSNVSPNDPGTTTEPPTEPGTGTGSVPVSTLPPESTGGASTAGDPAPAPPVDGLIAPPPPDDGTDPVVVAEEIGVCTAIPEPCTADEQCDEGYYCSIAFAAAPSVTCAPNEDCTEVPVSDPALNPGTCIISPLTCSDSEPCPEATTCDAGYCAYKPTECANDDECDAGYSCAVTSRYEECSICAGAGSGTGMTAPGSGTTPTTGTTTAPAGVAAAGAGSSAEPPPPDGADRIAVPPEEGGGAAPAPCTTVCTTMESRSCLPTPDVLAAWYRRHAGGQRAGLVLRRTSGRNDDRRRNSWDDDPRNADRRGRQRRGSALAHEHDGASRRRVGHDGDGYGEHAHERTAERTCSG
jgi:hypothetical protein